MDFPGQIDPVLQKEKLLTSGRDSAAYLAGVMQNLALTGSERAELRACCDQLEQYVRVLALTTKADEISSIGYRMAEILAECVGIISRMQDRFPPGQ
jgi:hypothetical protein